MTVHPKTHNTISKAKVAHKVCVHFDNVYFTRNGSEATPFLKISGLHTFPFGLDIWLDSTLKVYHANECLDEGIKPVMYIHLYKIIYTC